MKHLDIKTYKNKAGYGLLVLLFSCFLVSKCFAYTALNLPEQRGAWAKLPLNFSLNPENSGIDTNALKAGIAETKRMKGSRESG